MLDEKDMRIIEELMANGRKSVVEVSDKLGLPRATVQERLRKLVESGVIRRFAALPDYAKLGKQVAAYVFVAFSSDEKVSQRDLAEQISLMPGVYEVSVISGQWDILLKVRGASVEEIGSLVIDRLRALKGIEKTETCVAFQTIRESV